MWNKGNKCKINEKNVNEINLKERKKMWKKNKCARKEINVKEK